MPIVLSQVNEETNTETDIYQTIGSVWEVLRIECEKSLSREQCAGLLGYRPIYFPPGCVEKPKFPWWAYLGIGYLAGKFII